MDGSPSDAALLAGVADRDLGAFRALYERHAGWLALRLARRCNDTELVADAVQDTFVALWQKPQGVACHRHGTTLAGNLPAPWDHLFCQSWDHPACRPGEPFVRFLDARVELVGVEVCSGGVQGGHSGRGA